MTTAHADGPDDLERRSEFEGATTIEGTILAGREFHPVEGRVVFEDGRITAVEEASVDSDAIVLPAFVNAHTHIGDSIAKEAGEGLSLEELVAPPDGLKHQLLEAADRESMVEAMRRSLRYMASTGTGAFLEFREGGLEGVELIRDALEESPIEPVILGRETVAAMRESDGFGASGARDGEFSSVREATREAGKLFGIHAGERDSDDINPALDLDPSFLVHMTHVRELHLDRLEDRAIPVVVCPRSNLVTNVGVPPIRELVERTTVALGTDNVMLNSPSMFREMEFASKLSDVPAATVLRMATINGAETAGLNCGLIEAGRDARLLVLDGGSNNLEGVTDVRRAVVRRAGHGDVSRVIL
ncbi:Cytosine deaminase or related metal-dependent hydrolase [Halalkaliarchaeum sp. AArc-CO]|uniref:amidohydrolase family protein n=1 Tax=unclassified Halalkaliarchaeum TaxID=2678344 RepID=UPI00217D7A60|nr:MULTISPECIES: amidohydrolase family protein [unclassified Halalkaliarchaeum]MDR5672963.1 amidohydrolase family protein [Halalkaliarchaeum sp. AArc-GB]UWG50306.1 Cytosine deaminase or related metal-dependent hydrolase [Halalkaliarchaeum sp. AArc-CO]